VVRNIAPYSGAEAALTVKELQQELAKEFVEPDWCRKGHIGYVLEGQMEVNFDGKVIVFGPGDGIFIPSGEGHKHKGTVITEAAKVVLVEDV
jgi:quercetin dioxygenase-like cupin family protein